MVSVDAGPLGQLSAHLRLELLAMIWKMLGQVPLVYGCHVVRILIALFRLYPVQDVLIIDFGMMNAWWQITLVWMPSDHQK